MTLPRGSRRSRASRRTRALRETLRAKGKARYPRFSWRAGARGYLDLALALSPRTAGEPRGAGAPLVGGHAS